MTQNSPSTRHSIIDADGLLFQSAYKVDSVEEAFKKLVNKLNELTNMYWDQDGSFTLFMEGPGNWRKDIFPEYKGARKLAEDPWKDMRYELYAYLKEQKFAISAIGCETDDLVRRKAESMRKRGQGYIVYLC